RARRAAGAPWRAAHPARRVRPPADARRVATAPRARAGLGPQVHRDRGGRAVLVGAPDPPQPAVGRPRGRRRGGEVTTLLAIALLLVAVGSIGHPPGPDAVRA